MAFKWAFYHGNDIWRVGRFVTKSFGGTKAQRSIGDGQLIEPLVAFGSHRPTGRFILVPQLNYAGPGSKQLFRATQIYVEKNYSLSSFRFWRKIVLC